MPNPQELQFFLEAEGIRKTFDVLDGVPLLDGVDFAFRSGEAIGLTGPGGSGKTTLVKILCGLLSGEEGEVRYGGTPLEKMPQTAFRRFRRNVTMTFQQGGLFDSLSVEENLEMVCEHLMGLSKRDAKEPIAKVLRDVGLEDAASFAIAELSGGMQKRLGVARALLLAPRLVFFDDPTAGLDPVTASSIIDLIGEQHASKSTGICVVTSDPGLLRWVDRIYFLHHGRIHATGSFEEFKASDDLVLRQFFHGLLVGPLTF